MKVGVIGTGRMGRILSERMTKVHEVTLLDADGEAAKAAAAALGVRSVQTLAELDVEAVVAAVPDSAVESCVKAWRAAGKAAPLFSVATNISREMLAEFDAGAHLCLNVKIIGHAGEMSHGAQPILIVDDQDLGLVETARAVFAPVGEVVTGEADRVKQINSLITEAALKAGVEMEAGLRGIGVMDERIIRAALSIVGTGVLRAYAEDDLGPFARGIVNALRSPK